MKNKDTIALTQFERRIKPLRKNLESFRIQNGWIHYVRSVLGMKLSTLARLAKTTSSTVQQAEKREAQNKVTLETLRRMAEAMGCEFVYAFVPKKEIKDLIKERAYNKAKKILVRADIHMSLEDQKVNQDFDERVARLANKLIETGEVW
jgi:predicted DNA-binding mobile mystery protein A